MTLHKLFCFSTVALGLFALGISQPSVSHASHAHHAQAYLLDDYGIMIPRDGDQDDVDAGIGSPDDADGYTDYLNGTEAIWSKPGYYCHDRYIPRGVRITDLAGSRRLARQRYPFKYLRTKDDNILLVTSPAYRGWIESQGMYHYSGIDGRLPIHHMHRHARRTHKHVIRKHYRHAGKRHAHYKHHSRKHA